LNSSSNGTASGGADPWWSNEAYEDFRCEVTALPFGMSLRAPVGGAPAVEVLVPGRPAEALGVHFGDILVEVAGRPVDGSSWFAALQQAVPPYGLRFRRMRSS